jgi:putative spermidine/putrescine transport system ATP-binding protein
MAELELIDVGKHYKTVEAVAGVSLEVEEGEFFSLLGPSGCGKTTLLRLIAGFVQPTAGRILLKGKDIAGLPPEKRNMGMVFQNYAIFPHMTCFDNIAFGLRMRKIPKEEIRRRVEQALTQVDLVGYERRYQRELSGGETQRIAIARVLVIEPRLLLLDEPLSALDKKLREEMKYWIKELQQALGITTIYVTHDQSEAMAMSDRIAVMNLGRVEQVGTAREIYERPGSRFVSSFIGEANLLEGEVSNLDKDGINVLVEGLEVRATHSDEELHQGQQVSVMVRPENVVLGPHAAGLDCNRCRGTVLHRTYQGTMVRYEMELTSLQHVLADSSQTGEADLLTIGQSVDLGWEAESVVVLTS